ncbi:MAG: response regulator [Candidatus Marinimicrobia bacterium]|nr:response regulator [bacterium]MCG2716147.1 response regulator [Candidatus Neomarinimicrobiota bacterium]
MNSKNTLKIMVIDDDPEILESFKKIFENSGFQLFLANNGVTAIEEMNHEKYHIAFIDLYMPVMNGLETMIRLKESNPDLIAVMISGFRNEQMLEAALKSGAHDYLYKPLDVQDIIGITLKLSRQLGIQSDLEVLFE